MDPNEGDEKGRANHTSELTSQHNSGHKEHTFNKTSQEASEQRIATRMSHIISSQPNPDFISV